MTIRKTIQSFTLILLLAAGGFLAFRVSAGADDQLASSDVPSSRLLPVDTLQLQEISSYSRVRQYTGLLKEAKRSRLSFQRGGEVVELLADEGDAVAKGQVLARLDARHLEARRAQLGAEISEAQAVLAELEAGPRRETIAAKRAELKAQHARRESLSKQVRRRGQLVDTTAVSREEFETFSFDLAAASAQVERLQSELEELLAGTRKEQITAQQARLAQLQAGLADLEHDLEDTVIKAPYAGRIGTRLLDEGTVVSPGTVVFVLLDDTNLEAWIGLPVTASAQQFAVGDTCPVEVNGREYAAQVRSLAAEVDTATRTQMIRLRLAEQQNGTVLPGQVARISVAENVQTNGFWVPTAALSRGTRGLWSVYVVDSNDNQSSHRVAQRDVELLETLGDRSFVRGTLVSGDLLVADGAHRIVAGQRVALRPAQTTQASR